MQNKVITTALQNVITHFYRLLRQERNDYFKQYSLTPVQYDVLRHLAAESLNLISLSEQVMLDSSTLVGVVERLAARGWIKKKVSPKDRRMTILSLTDEGRQFLNDIPDFVSPILEEVMTGLENKDRQHFVRILKKILIKMNCPENFSGLSDNENKPLKPAIVL